MLPPVIHPQNKCACSTIVIIILSAVVVVTIGSLIYLGCKSKNDSRDFQLLDTSAGNQHVDQSFEDEFADELVIKPKKFKNTVSNEPGSLLQRTLPTLKFLAVSVAAYLLFFQGWFAVNAACDRNVGAMETDDGDKNFLHRIVSIPRWFMGKTGDNWIAPLFGPEAVVCAAYNSHGGVEMGRAVFNPVLQNVHGNTLTTQKEFQTAWRKNYAAQIFGAVSTEPKNNMGTQFVISALCFMSGYTVLKYYYPEYAKKLMMGICTVSVFLSNVEATRFGIVSLLAGGACRLGGMYLGISGLDWAADQIMPAQATKTKKSRTSASTSGSESSE